MKITNVQHPLLVRRIPETVQGTAQEAPGSGGAAEAMKEQVRELRETRRASMRRVRKEQEYAAEQRRFSKASKYGINPDGLRRNLTYLKHRASNSYFVRVIDASTDKVIREVPPEEQLDRIARMREFIASHYRF